MDENYILALFLTGVIISSCVICCVSLFDDSDDYEYVNVLTNVTDKYSNSYTTMIPISNGKSTYVVPSTTTDYYIITGCGNVSVSSSEYSSLKKGDMVVLTKNLNTSSLEYNCMVVVSE